MQATGYKVRMVCLEWWLQLYAGDELVDRTGPLSHAEAMAAADASGLEDIDKRDVADWRAA
jgi:hypothetical protein